MLGTHGNLQNKDKRAGGQYILSYGCVQSPGA